MLHQHASKLRGWNYLFTMSATFTHINTIKICFFFSKIEIVMVLFNIKDIISAVIKDLERKEKLEREENLERKECTL